MSASADLPWASAAELAARVQAGALSPTEIAENMVARVEDVNPHLNALVHFDRDQVLWDAENLTRAQRGSEPLGPLHGVPFTIKDLTAMRGLPLTFGLRPMSNHVGDHDAVVVSRLRQAGGLFLGKTNTPESGYYGGCHNHLFGATHNPWKQGSTSGGSSGGAAAAVASGLGPIAEGSDGAGSVRIPSSLCGVVGLKPSMGRIPQTILPGRHFSWLYHGPITRTVGDAALLLDVLTGAHSADPLSLPAPSSDYRSAMRHDIRGWRIAWSPNLGFGEVDDEVLTICHSAVSAFDELGATVTTATPQWGDPEQAMWHGIWVPGFASERDLLEWDELHGQVDENLIELMHEGDRLSATDVGRADAFRGQMWDTFAHFMADFDLLISPTVCCSAFPAERFAPERLDGASLRRKLLGWILTYPFNMLTTPAITVPAGFTSDGTPVGLQLCGKLHRDADVIRAAANFETARPWHHHRPELSTSR